MEVSSKRMLGFYGGEPTINYDLAAEKIIIDHNHIFNVICGLFAFVFILACPIYVIWLAVNELVNNQWNGLIAIPSYVVGIIMSWLVGSFPLFVFLKCAGNQRIEIDFRHREIDFEQLGIRGHYRSKHFSFDSICAVQLLKINDSELTFEYQVLLVYTDDGAPRRRALFQSNIFDRAELLASSLSRQIGCELLVGVD
ncbi:hypothetical protein K2Y11_03690 [bacterium]|nr:hypothetical protein [bacterium]